MTERSLYVIDVDLAKCVAVGVLQRLVGRESVSVEEVHHVIRGDAAHEADMLCEHAHG